MKNCGSCASYSDTRLNGIICLETGKPVGYLQERPCWKPICEVIAPCQSEAAAPAETKPEKRMGRPARFPNKFDHETGKVLKHCRCCGEYKPLEEFPKNKTHNDGHASECKACHNVQTLESARKRRAAMKARKEAAAPEAPAAAAATVKASEPKPTPEKPVKTLASYTDTELAEELKSRGWSGVLTKALQLGQ